MKEDLWGQEDLKALFVDSSLMLLTCFSLMIKKKKKNYANGIYKPKDLNKKLAF